MPDLLFMAFFVAAGVAALRSDMRLRTVCLALLVGLLVSRMSFDSWGGGLAIFEIPGLLFLLIDAGLILARRRSRQPTVAT